MKESNRKRGLKGVLLFLLVISGLIVGLAGVSAIASTTVLVDNLQPSWTAPGGVEFTLLIMLQVVMLLRQHLLD